MFAQIFLNPFLTMFAPTRNQPARQRPTVASHAKLKQQLAAVVDDEHAVWNALLAGIDPQHMTEPGVAGDWTFRDLTAHLYAWRDGGLRLLEAEARGEPEPPAPWPATLTNDDAINAWLFERDRALPLEHVLAAYADTFARMHDIVRTLPDAALTEPGYFPWMPGQSLAASMLDRSWFDHLHIEHEPQIRRWIERGPSVVAHAHCGMRCD